MNPTLLSFYPKFLLSEKTGSAKTPKAQIFDTTPWVAQGIALADVAGVILSAKRQGVSFYANTDFDNPDVTLDPAVNVKIDVPTDDNDEILFGEYEFQYKTRVYNELIDSNQDIDALGSSPVTSFVLSDTGFTGTLASNITALVALLGSNFTVQFLNSSGSVLATSVVTGASYNAGPSVTTITCQSVAISGYASVTAIRFVTYYSATEVVNYCAQTWPDAVLSVTGDCIKAQILVQDQTQYLASDSNTRVINFNYPVLANGTPVESPETTSAASLLVGPNVWTGSYTISLTTTIERDNADDVLVLNYVLTKYNYFILDCDAGLCCMKDCIKTIFNSFKDAVQNGSMNLPTLQNNMITILTYVQLYDIALNCGDTELAGTYLESLKNYLNSIGCECSCQDQSSSNEPTIVYPLFSDPLPNYVPISYLENDDITVNSNVRVPTNKAVINYVADAIASSLVGYLTSAIAANTYMPLQPFVSTNTVSGNESISLNGKSGVINFNPSSPLPSGDVTVITLTNTSIALTSMVLFTLDYDSVGLGVELVIYSIEVLAGSVKLTIKNNGSSPLDDTIKIRFIVL